MLVNTQEFKREGLFYLKHGQYDHGIKGSPTYKNFWKRLRKAREQVLKKKLSDDN